MADIEKAVELGIEKGVKQALIQMSTFASNTLSRVEIVQHLKNTRSYIFSKQFDDALTDYQVDWWPNKAKDSFPNTNDAEIDTCQNFVSEMLDYFKSGEVNVITSKKQRKSQVKVISVQSIPDPLASEKMTLARRFPDSLFYDGLKKKSPTAITMLGEVKGGGIDEFPLNEVGQLVDGLKRLMDIQPFRTKSIGFLTDGRRFLFLRCERRETYFHFDHSSIFEDKTGWQVKTNIIKSVFVLNIYVGFFNLFNNIIMFLFIDFVWSDDFESIRTWLCSYKHCEL